MRPPTHLDVIQPGRPRSIRFTSQVILRYSTIGEVKPESATYVGFERAGVKEQKTLRMSSLRSSKPDKNVISDQHRPKSWVR